MEGLIGFVIFLVLFAVLTGSRPSRVTPPREEEPEPEPWPYPTVSGLVQPESPSPHLRKLHEFLKWKWRKDVAEANSPECVATALHQMAESGARNCRRCGAPDLGRRFGLLRDGLWSRLRDERGSSQEESEVAMEEMTLLISTLAAMARRRYVG